MNSLAFLEVKALLASFQTRLARLPLLRTAEVTQSNRDKPYLLLQKLALFRAEPAWAKLVVRVSVTPLTDQIRRVLIHAGGYTKLTFETSGVVAFMEKRTASHGEFEIGPHGRNVAAARSFINSGHAPKKDPLP